MAAAKGKAEKVRSVEEAVSYAIGHRLRVEILAALHEGPKSAKELARILRQPLSNVTHHVEELRASGSIGVAGSRRIGNVVQNFYSMRELPVLSDEDLAAMSPEERQVTAGIVLQAMAAEALAALWAGKMQNDPRVMMAWKRVNLDEQGRREIADEQLRSWHRMLAIEGEAARRCQSEGKRGRAYVITSLGYERGRSETDPPERPHKS